jgi:cold shock CspA family protein
MKMSKNQRKKTQKKRLNALRKPAVPVTAIPKSSTEEATTLVEGVVTKYRHADGFGFIQGANNKSYFAHVSNIKSGEAALVKGDKVTFVPAKSNRIPKSSDRTTLEDATEISGGSYPEWKEQCLVRGKVKKLTQERYWGVVQCLSTKKTYYFHGSDADDYAELSGGNRVEFVGECRGCAR